MGEVLKALERIHDRIGWQSEVLVTMAVLIKLFVEKVPTHNETADAFCDRLAWVLFAAGTLLGLLKAFASFFKNRPARGMVDGLAAGLFAGLVGGSLGYGIHSGPGYVDHAILRIGLCTLFAMPVGGVLGLCFDLMHPDRAINWRTGLGVIALGLALLFLLVSFGMSQFIPVMKGIGATLGDVQLLFETYILLASALAAFSFSWSRRRFLVQYGVLAAILAAGHVLTRWLPSRNLCQYPVARHLADRQFTAGDDGLGCPDDRALFAVVIVVLMFWSLLAYAVFFKTGARDVRQVSPDRPVIPVDVAPLLDGGDDG
jgi:hypothetical protein